MSNYIHIIKQWNVISHLWLNTCNDIPWPLSLLTHWGRVTHICVGNLTIIGSDNGLSPGRRQAIIWTNAGILSIGPLGTNFNEISIGIETFSFKKMHFKTSSAKWRLFCLGLNVLTQFDWFKGTAHLKTTLVLNSYIFIWNEDIQNCFSARCRQQLYGTYCTFFRYKF